MTVSHAAVRRVDDLTEALEPSAPVVTLYSGGLDSTHLLLLLAERGFTDITALAVELGDNVEVERAATVCSALGVRLCLVDRRRRFVEEFVFPAVQAHAVYLGLHPISSSLSRALIAQEGIGHAKEIGARAIVHTASRSQNTLRRLNGALRSLGFTGAFGSPYDLSAIPRQRKRRDLIEAGFTVFAHRPISMDANLWCREFESGVLDDPEDFTVPEELYRWSKGACAPPATTVELTFERGVPVALDGEQVDGVDLVARLNWLAGGYGLGRYSGLEHLDTGEKVLEVREMPAAELLLLAYRQLESATVAAETVRAKLAIEQLWVREAVEGRWFGELRRAAHAFIDEVRTAVTGTITVELAAGKARVASIRAGRPLYLRSRERWEVRQSADAAAGGEG